MANNIHRMNWTYGEDIDYTRFYDEDNPGDQHEKFIFDTTIKVVPKDDKKILNGKYLAFVYFIYDVTDDRSSCMWDYDYNYFVLYLDYDALDKYDAFIHSEYGSLLPYDLHFDTFKFVYHDIIKVRRYVAKDSSCCRFEDDEPLHIACDGDVLNMQMYNLEIDYFLMKDIILPQLPSAKFVFDKYVKITYHK